MNDWGNFNRKLINICALDLTFVIQTKIIYFFYFEFFFYVWVEKLEGTRSCTSSSDVSSPTVVSSSAVSSSEVINIAYVSLYVSSTVLLNVW